MVYLQKKLISSLKNQLFSPKNKVSKLALGDGYPASSKPRLEIEILTFKM